MDVDSLDGLKEALAGTNGHAVAERLSETRYVGLVVDGRSADFEDGTVAARLGAYEQVEGLQAEYLAPAAALYVPHELEPLSEVHLAALAHVARELVAGTRPPRVSSFPEPLRRIRDVEVMVMLKRRGRRRLWRSARGSSIGRALITAAVVARQRWQERQQAMGAPIDDMLDELDVGVTLLGEDGNLGDRTPAFVNSVFTARHGVAYERHGAWRYLLPAATGERGGGSAANAYEELFVEQGLEPDAFHRSDIRLYRLVTTVLAVSPARPRLGDSSANSADQDDEFDAENDGGATLGLSTASATD